MKTEFRRKLAQLPFAEKIRKVGELIGLSHAAQRQRLRGSLKGTKAAEVFISEGKREREL